MPATPTKLFRPTSRAAVDKVSPLARKSVGDSSTMTVVVPKAANSIAQSNAVLVALPFVNNCFTPTFSIVIGVFEAVGVASLVLGIYARPMSLFLGAFMLVVTVLFVRFWSEQGEKQSADRNVFFSNLSIVGGCLLLAISGPGRMAFAT